MRRLSLRCTALKKHAAGTKYEDVGSICENGFYPSHCTTQVENGVTYTGHWLSADPGIALSERPDPVIECKQIIAVACITDPAEMAFGTDTSEIAVLKREDHILPLAKVTFFMRCFIPHPIIRRRIGGGWTWMW